MPHAVRRVVFVLAPALALVGLAVGTANAAVTGTLNAAVVHGSDFTWTCDINPGGSTIYVAGRSWFDPSRPGYPAVDTPRQQISGTTTQRLTFSRDGDALTRYGYRCVWFSSATTTTLLGRTADALFVTTGADTIFGSNVDHSTYVPCVSGTAGCACDLNGLNCQRLETFDEALARQDAEYAPKMLRIYWPDRPSTDCSVSKNAVAVERPTIQSWKGDPAQVSAGTYNATLNAWLSCFRRPTRVTLYHEPEDNFTTSAQKTAYRAAWDSFITLVQAHPNHANLIPTIILMDWDLEAGSGRNWRDWYTPRVQELWWDVYSFNDRDADSSDNETMAQHQTRRPSLAVSKAEGKPYGIGELGYDDPGPRPAFLSDVAAWARSNNIVGVAYFDAIGKLGDHRLLDSASQTAWRTVCSG